MSQRRTIWAHETRQAKMAAETLLHDKRPAMG